jgi:hypothetical protein
MLDVIKQFHRDAHEGRPLALRLTSPHPFPAPSFTFAPPRRTGLVHHPRTLTEATTERCSGTRQLRNQAQPNLSATTIGTRHHDEIRPGWSSLSRSELNGNSPKHFLSHPRHLHQKRWRGRDTHLCCAATNERRGAIQSRSARVKRSVRTFEQSDARSGGPPDRIRVSISSTGHSSSAGKPCDVVLSHPPYHNIVVYSGAVGDR